MDLDLSKMILQTEEVSEVKFVPYKELEQMVADREEELLMHEEEFRRLFELLNSRRI